MEKYKGDILILKWHGLDFMLHLFMHLIDPEHPLYDPEKSEEGWKYFARFHKIIDDMIDIIIRNFDEESTIVSVVSDHGIISFTYSPNINEILERHGFLIRKPDGSIDWSKTKAYAWGIGVWINLKGREPCGIVDPSEYDEVVEEIIEVLRSERCPITGHHLFDLILKREDAEFMGVGNQFPDIIFCIKPQRVRGKVTRKEWLEILRRQPWLALSGMHGPYLPTLKFSIGTMYAVFIAKGPGLKRGYKSNRPIFLTDVIPTLCYLIDLPPPRHSEGRVVREFLEKW